VTTLDNGHFTWLGGNSQKEYFQAMAWKDEDGS
jgi:hypothetical protein